MICSDKDKIIWGVFHFNVMRVYVRAAQQESGCIHLLHADLRNSLDNSFFFIIYFHDWI